MPGDHQLTRPDPDPPAEDRLTDRRGVVAGADATPGKQPITGH